jgi:hypothetical protein
VWEVAFGNDKIKTSRDHLFFTNEGWKRLSEIADLRFDESSSQSSVLLAHIGPGKDHGVAAAFNVVDPDTEDWTGIVGWEDYYQVSTQGRVRRIVGGRGSRSYGRCKAITVSNGRAVVSLNKPGVQELRLVHQLMMEAFVGPCPDGQEVCHEDGNGLNNVLDNLRYGTRQSNADDRIRDGATTYLDVSYVAATIKYSGREMTYDLEVSGPWHNFSADGFVVHNSVNEYSTRYSEAIDSAQKTAPDKWRSQSTSNKQGSSGVIDPVIGATLSLDENALQQFARQTYEKRLSVGVAREQARKDLPLSTYTEAYWKIDLHNLFHFLSLRMDSHAQEEIRAYANIIGYEMVSKWCPLAWEAFLDFRLHAKNFSRIELAVIGAALREGVLGAREKACQYGLVKKVNDVEFVGEGRECSELVAKMTAFDIPIPWTMK